MSTTGWDIYRNIVFIIYTASFYFQITSNAHNR